MDRVRQDMEVFTLRVLTLDLCESNVLPAEARAAAGAYDRESLRPEYDAVFRKVLSYSARNDTSGSIRAARRAGI